MKHSTGITLIELLVGLLLFSLLIGFAAIGIRNSHQAFIVTRNDEESGMILLHGLDDAARIIRGCAAVEGGGSLIQCEDSQGSWSTLALANGTLTLNQTPLQAGLYSIDFSIHPGTVSNYVSISASSVSNHEQLGTTTKTLFTSVALRNNPQPIPSPTPTNPLPAPSPSPWPTPTTPSPSPTPTPTPTGYICPPGYWGGGLIPCRPIPPILSGPNGRNVGR